MTNPPGPPQPPYGSSPYGSNPYPQGQPQQYPPQPQYPTQPPHNYGQPQYPGQQYPGQQYPGQQYPGQQYPNQPQQHAGYGSAPQTYPQAPAPGSGGSTMMRILAGVVIAAQLVIAGLCFGTWLRVDVDLFNSSESKATGTFSGFGRVALDGKKVSGTDANSPAIGTIIVATVVLILAVIMLINRLPLSSGVLGSVGAVLGVGSLGWLIVVWSDLPKYVAGVSNAQSEASGDYSAGWGLIGCVVCVALTIGLFVFATISSFMKKPPTTPPVQPYQNQGPTYPGQPTS